METAETEEYQMDCVDQALEAVLDDCLDDKESEQDYATASEILMDVFAYLVDSEEIEDAPEEDEPEEVKQEWIAKNMPKIRSAMKEALDVNSDMA